MRLLITGGNGFLGSNLIEHVLNLGHQVFVISRNSNNISEFLSSIKFERYESNNYFSHEQSILDFDPDAVIHLAWEGGNSHNDSNHLNQIYKNIPASMSLLEIIQKQFNKPKFIGCGSFLEYGTISDRATESMIENPNNFYGLSKLFFKKSSEMYCDQNSIPWTWIRPCYIYGKKDVKTRLIPSAIHKLLDGQDLKLDDCSMKIDYLHIEDFCSAVLGIATSNVLGTFNICSGKEYSLREVICLIKNKVHSNSDLIFDQSLNSPIKPKYVCGSNDRLKSAIDWIPEISLSDGILKTISYYKLNAIRI